MYEVRNPMGTIAWCATEEIARQVAGKVLDGIVVAPAAPVRNDGKTSFLEGLKRMYAETDRPGFNRFEGWK